MDWKVFISCLFPCRFAFPCKFALTIIPEMKCFLFHVCKHKLKVGLGKKIACWFVCIAMFTIKFYHSIVVSQNSVELH